MPLTKSIMSIQPDFSEKKTMFLKRKFTKILSNILQLMKVIKTKE